MWLPCKVAVVGAALVDQRLSASRPQGLQAYTTTSLIACMVACRHTTRFIIWYVVFLPLGLWTYCTWTTLFIAPLITFMLAGAPVSHCGSPMACVMYAEAAITHIACP